MRHADAAPLLADAVYGTRVAFMPRVFDGRFRFSPMRSHRHVDSFRLRDIRYARRCFDYAPLCYEDSCGFTPLDCRKLPPLLPLRFYAAAAAFTPRYADADVMLYFAQH